MDASLKGSLLRWYRSGSRRALPWRGSRDPYRVWVSEIMLQQTQVRTVIPYYRRFLKRFPTLESLARARLSTVLEHWSGLGYYSRARNLHAAAQAVRRRFAGRVPEEAGTLLTLPGVGRYTAGAIASIAFGRRAPVLDGNVTRVLTRFFGIRQSPAQPAVRKKLWALAGQILPRENPGDFNQALMDLGALLCTPRRPDCPACPVAAGCAARRAGLQERIPPPRIPVPRKRISYVCGIVERDGSILIARRPVAGLLGGLWEFPGGERRRSESELQALRRLLKERLGVRARTGPPRGRTLQILTHREIDIRAFACETNGNGSNLGGPARRDALRESALPANRLNGYTALRWVSKRSLRRQPLTAGMRDLAEQLW